MEVAEQWRRQFSLGEPGENVTGSMAVLRARAPGARLSIVRTEWRSTGRTTATGTTSSTRTVRGVMRGSTRMTNNREPEKLSSPSLVSRKPLEISTTRLESDDDSSVEQKYQVSEPSDTETSEPTSWTRPQSQPADNSSSNLSTGYSRNNDLFNDIDNFIIKPSQLRKCSTISEESLNEVRNRIRSLVTNGSQSNTSDSSESRFRDDDLKVGSPVSRVKTFISKMESNAEAKYETSSIGSKSSTRSLQNSYDDDSFEKGYTDRSSDKLLSFRSKPIDFSSESDFSVCDQTLEKPHRLKSDEKAKVENKETFQDWLSKNNKLAASSLQLPKNKSEHVEKWDSSIREKTTDSDFDSDSTGKISISIPISYENRFGTAKKKVIQHSLREGTTVSIESSKPHSIVTNASDIFSQDARHLAIGNHTVKDEWRNSNSPMSSRVSKTETKQVYNEELDENNEKKNKRVEFCKTEVHFAMESGQIKIVETDDKPPPTNNFRRRRKGSTFVPLAPVDREIPPVTLFGAATNPESYSFANLSDNPTGSERELQYSLENSGQLYREEGHHTVTSAFEHDVVPRGILKNKTIKPLPYHLGADYELGSMNRDDSVWGVKLKPVTNNFIATSGMALPSETLRQSNRLPNQNYENNNISNANGVDISNERIIKVRNERLQNSSLSVYEHLEKLKQSEKNKLNSSDTESELPGIPEKESIGVTQPGYNVLSPLHAPVSKSPELKTVAQLAPMSPTKSRKLRANELTYFGIQASPEHKRQEIKEKYSEVNIDNKPDIIKHTFINHKTAPISKYNKSQDSKEPAERLSRRISSDQPIYINVAAEQKLTPVAAPRSNPTKPEAGIEKSNFVAGEISKIADQYSNERSPWDGSINNDVPLETINQTRGHKKESKTTERKSYRVMKSTSNKTRPSPDKSKCIDIGNTVQRAPEKKLPVVKSHRPDQSSSLDSSVVPIETVIAPPARKRRTQTNENKTDTQARSDSRGKHRETKLDTATKQRSHHVIPVILESNSENPSRKHESNKGNNTRREHSYKDRKETTLEKRRTGDEPKVTKTSEIGESRHGELRGKQLRTPTPSSQLRSSSTENRMYSHQRDDRDRQPKHRQENREASPKRTHESRIISHPVKDGMISPSRSKRDTSSRDRLGKKDSGRVRERTEEYENRDKERKKYISSRQSPGKTAEKKKRLKVTLEMKNPLGPMIKQKNGAK